MDCKSQYSLIIEETEIVPILEEIKSLRSELVSIQSSFLSMISIALGAYGLIIYYAFQLNNSSNPNYLFIVLPFLFLISFNNIIKYTIKMLGMGGYIRFLEGLLNCYYKKPLFQWHSYLIFANGYGAVGGLAQLPCFLALSILVGVKFYENIQMIAKAKCLIIMLLGASILGVIASLAVCVTQSSTVEYWCKEISNKYSANDDNHFSTRMPIWMSKLFRKLGFTDSTDNSKKSDKSTVDGK